MRLRRMCAEDVPRVAAIEREAFSQPWSEQGFLDSLKLPHTVFLVAEGETGILGYLGMYLSAEEGEITNVAVAKNARNSGVGKALVQRALAEAEEAGTGSVVLEARASNAAAIRLYEGNGFSPVGVRRGFYELPREDAVIMAYSFKTRE